MWAATLAIGAEGVVAKRRDSRYHPGRSRWWLKNEAPRHRLVRRRRLEAHPPDVLVASSSPKATTSWGVAVVALPAAERAGLADLIDRYGRRHPTGIVTLPAGALCAQVSFMARAGVAVLREAVAHQVRPESAGPES